MANNILSEFAPKYWAAGLPVIPLKKWDDHSKGAGKAPILSEWTAYSSSMPSKTMQDHWVHSYPANNIGLPFGTASGLCAIDIDSEDDEIVQTIIDALPPSPWKRIGKKGCGLIYRWSQQKNFKLRNSENESLVEFLGMGNQMVMSGSIHPSTGKPYVSNTNLWEVLDQIVELPEDIEQVLRKALEPIMGGRGLTLANTGRSKPLEVVPEGNRDIQLVRWAGYLSRVVLGIDRSTRYTLMEAINHIYTWVAEFTATAAGDSMDPNKGVAKLLEFLTRDLEKGKTLPDGWDEGLTDIWLDHPTIAAMRGHNEVARWTLTKAVSFLRDKKLEAGEDLDLMQRSAEELIEAVARDENFTDMQFGQLCKTIQDVMGKDMAPSKPDLKKAFAAARRGDSGDVALDQGEIAEYVLEVLGRGGEVRFDVGFFWQWNGSCFQMMPDEEVARVVMKEVKGNMLSRRYSDYMAIVKVMQILARRPLVEEFEPGVNFANGYLTIDGVLREHSPKWGATFTMPFNYVPARAGECHKWLEFLESCWGEDEDYAGKVAALQEAFAATMFGQGTRFQRAVLLFGKAGTGKSVTLDVLREMMPVDAVCSIPPHVWREKFVLPNMVGKSLNVCGELPEAKGISGDIFKEVVDGTTQQIERKGKDPFDFKPLAMHWFASNFLPKSRDTSKGFSRRWLILEFMRTVAREDIIRDYAEILVADEREAIAAWAVLGLRRLGETNDFTLPPSHHVRIDQIVRSNNSVAAWLTQQDKIVPEEGAFADALECFEQYQFYTREISHSYAVSFERFKEMMGELGYEEGTYKDPLKVAKYMFSGLRVAEASMESKWKSAADD